MSNIENTCIELNDQIANWLKEKWPNIQIQEYNPGSLFRFNYLGTNVYPNRYFLQLNERYLETSQNCIINAFTLLAFYDIPFIQYSINRFGSDIVVNFVIGGLIYDSTSDVFAYIDCYLGKKIVSKIKLNTHYGKPVVAAKNLRVEEKDLIKLLDFNMGTSLLMLTGVQKVVMLRLVDMDLAVIKPDEFHKSLYLTEKGVEKLEFINSKRT